MKTLVIMCYLFMVAMMTVVGTFLSLGLPVNNDVASLTCFSLVFVGIERLFILCKVYKDE